MTRKNDKKNVVTLLVFGTIIFLGAYLVNIHLVGSEEGHEHQMANKSDSNVAQQVPWWKQWQHMYLSPFRGCKSGSGKSKAQISLDNQMVRNNATHSLVVQQTKGCMM